MHLKPAIFLQILFCVFLFHANNVGAYKYLAVLHTFARSHFAVGSSLMKALAEKGHEVYVISPFPQKQTIENYHDIPLPSILQLMESIALNLFSNNNQSDMQNMFGRYDMGIHFTEMILKEPGLHDLLASNHTFDAVLYDIFLCEALYGLSEHFKAPLIGLSTAGAFVWNTDMVGSPSPLSYVPNILMKFTDQMNLKERVINLAITTLDLVIMNYYYLPKQTALYSKYFPNVKRDMYEVRKNAALVLVNTHVSFGLPRPYMPNQVEVGGMHINRQVKPLPVEIEQFINDSPHGVIYLSMGSNLRSKDMPVEKKTEILKAFKSLKQRVLWKFEDINLEGRPDNVFISDWFPQDDILAHDNVKLFITHGGLLSITESIYHRTPIIGIPIFGDQFLNMAKAEKQGYGLTLDYQTLNAESLLQAINRILNDETFEMRITELSKAYNDQDMLPMDKAIFWMEHIVRQKGARYLHCAGLDLNFIEYHNIDAMLILFGLPLIVLFIIGYFMKFLLKSLVNGLTLKKNKTKESKRKIK